MKKILLLILVFSTLSCKKFLNEFSQDLVVVKTVSDLDELMLGSAYLPSSELISFVTSRQVSPWLHFLDDDVNAVVGTEYSFTGGWDPWKYPFMYGYATWQLDVSRAYDQTEGHPDDLTWNFIYTRINVLNMILEELKSLSVTTDSDILAAHRIKAEALFLRAQYYLLLTNIYGDAYSPESAAQKLGVPLKLTEFVEHVGGATKQFDRATIKDIYDQIVLDLKASIEAFDQTEVNKKVFRVSKPAAQLLLSRVYLYMQDWESAKLIAQEFVDKNGLLFNFSALKAGEPVITTANREVIFSHGNLNLQNVMSGSSDDFCVSKDLYSLFDSTDYRTDIYFGIHAQTDSVYLANKYKRGTHRSYVSDLFTIRNAEGYLNLAEAAAMSGDESLSNDILNKFRNYRYKAYKNLSFEGERLVNEIRIERRKELCFEGHRWFDLRRYAVNSIYPMQKDIIRIFSVFNQDSQKLQQIEVYRLPAGDPAYTFSIPKSVVEFESDLENNPRVARPYESLMN